MTTTPRVVHYPFMALALAFFCRWLGVSLYLIFLFIVVVILLNMLIAAMADTYSNVQSDAQRDLALARAWIVARVEHNSMLRIVRETPTLTHSHLRTCTLTYPPTCFLRHLY